MRNEPAPDHVGTWRKMTGGRRTARPSQERVEHGPEKHALGLRPDGQLRFSLRLEHDVIRWKQHHALALCLSMIFSENRFPLFRIML
jgi:hypothetical protein